MSACRDGARIAPLQPPEWPPVTALLSSARRGTAPAAASWQVGGGDGEPRRLMLPDFASRAPAWQRGEAESQETFHELLERASDAHDRELRATVDRLESEKHLLERQAEVLRAQLDIQGASSTTSDKMQSKKDTKKVHIADDSLVASHEPSPTMLSVSDCARQQDPAADFPRLVEGSGQGELPEKEERFPPREEYVEELKDIRSRSRSASMSPASSSRRWQSVRTTDADQGRESPSVVEETVAPYCFASPRSKSRLAWDVVGAVLICWDLFVVPLAVFCYPMNNLAIAMEWTTLVYWTLNVPQTLTVGYEVGLNTVMRPSSILLKYLKSWFLIDLIVLATDWIIVVLSFGRWGEQKTSCDSTVEGTEAVKLLRSLRLIRLMRLTRIARLQKVWDLIKERIYSQATNIGVNIFKMLVLLLIVSHFISCTWYAISSGLNGDNRWLVRYSMEGLQWNYLYATCLHWSLTQFTPAPIDIQPQNLSERTFTITVVFCALVGFSYVVGSITASLAQLRSLHEAESDLFWDLRAYLRRHHVEHILSVRIQRYLHNAWRERECHKTYHQVKALTMLSEQLENELLFSVHANHLTVHPLIRQLVKVSKVTAFRLARTAISTMSIANHDPIFIHNEKPSHMYIVIHGKVQYKRLTSEGVMRREMVDNNKVWISEPVLWSTEWYHMGDCKAVEESKLMLVNPHHFCQEAQRNPTAWALVTTYCNKFLKWLNSIDSSELSDITQAESKTKKMQLRSFATAQFVTSFRKTLK